MIKNYFFAALLLCLTASSTMAQDGKLNVLYVDGQSHELLLSDVAKLEVAGDNVVLVGANGATIATHDINDVERIDLTASTTAIGAAKTASSIRLSASGYAISAEGLADGKALEVFNANGQLVAKATANGGKATVDASAMANGIYVIKADGKSVKMIKK